MPSMRDVLSGAPHRLQTTDGRLLQDRLHILFIQQPSHGDRFERKLVSNIYIEVE